MGTGQILVLVIVIMVIVGIVELMRIVPRLGGVLAADGTTLKVCATA